MVAIPTDHAAFTEYRRALKGIGASEAAAALGIDPYTSPFELWERLTGRADGPAENKAMARGHRLEEVAADWVAEQTGWRLARVRRTVRDPRWPHLFAHPDRRVIGQRRLVQIKTRWRDFDEVPLHIQAQVQQEMTLAGAEAATLAVMTFEDLYLHDVPWEPAVALPMCDRLNAWYERHVVGDEPPRDTSEAYGRFLNREVREAEDPATVEQMAWLLELRDVREKAKALKSRENDLVVYLKESMAGGTALVGPGVRVSWKPHMQTVTGWQEVAATYRAALLEAGRSEDELDTLAGLYTRSVEVRPFRPTFEGEQS